MSLMSNGPDFQNLLDALNQSEQFITEEEKNLIKDSKERFEKNHNDSALKRINELMVLMQEKANAPEDETEKKKLDYEFE